MGKSYTSDLRERVVGLVEAGQSRRGAARQLSLSPSCAVKLVARWRRTRSLEPAKQGRPSGSGKLEPHRALLIGRVEECPDITTLELAAELKAQSGITVSPASLSCFLRAAGFTYKKLVPAKAGKHCWPRSRHVPTGAQARRLWVERRKDESAAELLTCPVKKATTSRDAVTERPEIAPARGRSESRRQAE